MPPIRMHQTPLSRLCRQKVVKKLSKKIEQTLDLALILVY